MFARQPADAEIESATEFLLEQEERHRIADATEPEVDAWADLAHALFMTKEFIFVR